MFIVFLAQAPPLPAAFPILLPPLEDSRLSAPNRVCPDLGVGDWVDGDAAGFLASFALGVVVVLKGFVNSVCGLCEAFVRGGDSGPGLVGVDGFETDENFELKLDIHEFRLPGGGCFVSLVCLGEL